MDESFILRLSPELRKFYPATSKVKDKAIGEERSRFKGSCSFGKNSRGLPPDVSRWSSRPPPALQRWMTLLRGHSTHTIYLSARLCGGGWRRRRIERDGVAGTDSNPHSTSASASTSTSATRLGGRRPGSVVLGVVRIALRLVRSVVRATAPPAPQPLGSRRYPAPCAPYATLHRASSRRPPFYPDIGGPPHPARSPATRAATARIHESAEHNRGGGRAQMPAVLVYETRLDAADWRLPRVRPAVHTSVVEDETRPETVRAGTRQKTAEKKRGCVGGRERWIGSRARADHEAEDPPRGQERERGGRAGTLDGSGTFRSCVCRCLRRCVPRIVPSNDGKVRASSRLPAMCSCLQFSLWCFVTVS